jgi:hypothetical protein
VKVRVQVVVVATVGPQAAVEATVLSGAPKGPW